LKLKSVFGSCTLFVYWYVLSTVKNRIWTKYCRVINLIAFESFLHLKGLCRGWSLLVSVLSLWFLWWWLLFRCFQW